MSTKGAATREKLLDTAEEMILDRGFSGMSIDKLIDALGVTKGAFFHHFKSKKELGTKLIRRYSDRDLAFFQECLARGEKLSTDPLQQVLITIGLYQELFESFGEPHPGCLLASYIYELQIFDKDIRLLINRNFLTWRKEMVIRFERVAEVYPPVIEVNFSALADEFLVLIEGAFILAKSLDDPQVVVEQLQLYRQTLELIFQKT